MRHDVLLDPYDALRGQCVTADRPLNERAAMPAIVVLVVVDLMNSRRA